MTHEQVTTGLVLPNAAVALLGRSGAIYSLSLIFMAVTSASSAELISISSIFTYDIYKTYLNSKASSRSSIFMSHACVVTINLAMAGFAVGLFYIGISMGYLYLLMGAIISSAVIPVTLTIMWKGQNVYAAAGSTVCGFCLALIAWLVTAHQKFGELTVESTGSDIPMLAGNVTALLSSVVLITIFALIFKLDDFDWNTLKEIQKDPDTEEEKK
ncbi:hypothetical protein NADFUDRAFT_70957 [Nadsonia fulvescens var. elongata DSM 6958]|uniref:Na+/solute symporter n=1 Tax=Nadsonia fulvescens var. elongata DSM 6958 TaxID=857566 RepID=A0A1E3PGG2_9ASCO|nr:hypothetical protein NADFUDRAFT_70957 [Nadsonia fulvescens var. elongata DSM 6958]